MKKPVDDAVPVRPPCVKRPGEECSCGDTGCDGPPVFVPSPESASVCSSYDVFCAKVPVSKSCVAEVPKAVVPNCFVVSENNNIRTDDGKFQAPLRKNFHPSPAAPPFFPPKNDAQNPRIFSADEPKTKPLGVSREPARAQKRTPDASARQ